MGGGGTSAETPAGAERVAGSAEAAARAGAVAGLAPGLLATIDQVASAVASVATDSGMRALDLRVWGGIDARLLPDRGFDVGAAWYRGVPLAWLSGVGEVPPLGVSREGDWTRAFGGGLVTTCGLRNVGAPSEGHPQHGEISHQRAREVAVARYAAPGLRGGGGERADRRGRRAGLPLRGAAHGAHAHGGGAARARGRDPQPGPGSGARPAALPLQPRCAAVAAGSTLSVDGSEVRPRDADAAAAAGSWHAAPGGVAGSPERVFEHILAPGDDGWASATVTSPATGLELTLRWDAGPLPRLWQWVHPAPGVGALGLEPTNCSVLGRGADRAAGRLPVLAPGEARVTRLELRVGDLP